MKNRLISLALCLVMVLSTLLVGCSKSDAQKDLDKIEDEASANNLSLTMWMVSENKVDEATAARISAAASKITKREFKTALTIRFLTKDEYQEKLSSTIRDFENTRGTAVTQPATPQTPTNGLDERYPELLENQVDIIYIDGEDMYREYVNNSWLLALDTELSSSSKKIKEYVAASVLASAKYMGGTYAIPNNQPIGEYTMMLLNKELMQKTDMHGKYLQGKIDGFFNEAVFTFVEDMVREGNTNIVPIASDYQSCLDLLAHYWSINPDTYEEESDKFSVLGYRYTDPAKLSRGETILSFNNLFADEVFVENYLKLNEYRLNGNYFGEETAGKTAAVKFVTGTVADYQNYSSESSEYYPVIVKYPTATSSQVYNSMFGVYTYARDLSRCMKVITLLNTDANFRNLIQYGELGVDYQIVETDGVKTVSYLKDDYRMDVFKTGNTFIAYPEPTMDADIWENGKNQNIVSKVDPFLNFDFAKEAKNTTLTTVKAPTLDATGYTYSYTTGYNKTILSQNSYLKNWIKECDAKGAGIYVLNSAATSGQNTTSKVYFYNNGLSANVSVNPSVENGVLTLAYTNASGTSQTPGYEITVIDSYAKKSSVLSYSAATNGAAVQPVEKKQNSLINFDFFNTKTYSITADIGITKSMLANNAAVVDWMKNSTNSSTAAAPCVMTYQKTVGEKTYYTYLIFAKTSKKISTAVQPLGDDKNLTVFVDHKDQGSSSGASYAMTLVTVVADNDVNVTFNLPGAVMDPVANDPQICLYGALDTEMVKYLYNLNAKIEAKLMACTTIDEMKALINDIQTLLTTQDISKEAFDHQKYSSLSDAFLQDLLPDYNPAKRSNSLSTLNWYLVNATAKAKVNRMASVYDEKTETDKWAIEETDPRVSEAYTYFNSPYMVYFNWLKANGLAK